MPIELKIVEGPPFKKFMHMSNVISELEWIQTFEFKHLLEKARKTDIFIITIGRLHKKGEENDTYSFIGYRHSDLFESIRYGANSHLLYAEKFYYVGEYNTRTRKGACTMLTAQEFFACPLSRMLFRELGEEHDRLMKKIGLAKSPPTQVV